MNRVALFVGSHADDIELGAGATVAKLSSDNWDVWLLILTRDRDEDLAAIRMKEALEAAAVLGVDSDHVLFANLPDTRLVCDGASVEVVRGIVDAHAIEPTIVFTHTNSDSHKDHREARAIAIASFRRRVFFGFAVVNSLVRAFTQFEGFRPSLFIDATRYVTQKYEALRRHRSQDDRIDIAAVGALMREYGGRIATEAAEAFEVLVQEGVSHETTSIVSALNHSPFHQVWSNLLGGERELMILHAEPVWRKQRDATWRSDMDREGIALIQKAFRRESNGRVPIEDRSCEVDNVDSILAERDILLSGGAVSNVVTRTYFNHFKGIRFVIDYTIPGFRDIRIRDQHRNSAMNAEYALDLDTGDRRLVRDLGILTLMPNPFNRSRILIGCMGIHGYGSLACFMYLSHSDLLSELKSLIPLPLSSRGYQAIIQYDVAQQEARLDSASFTEFDLGDEST